MAFILRTNEYVMAGKVEMPFINQQCIEANVTGWMIATEKMHFLVQNKLRGNGLIKGPQLSLEVGDFQFTGTINCTGKCTIISTKTFDPNMFKRAGGGNFEITIKEPADKKEEQKARVEEVTDKIHDIEPAPNTKEAKPANPSVASPSDKDKQKTWIENVTGKIAEPAPNKEKAKPANPPVAPPSDKDLMPSIKRGFWNP